MGEIKLDLNDLIKEPDLCRDMSEEDIKDLLQKVFKCIKEEPILLNIDKKKMFVAGDTHGFFDATKYIVNEFFEKKYDALLFLGDYVDRGFEQIENINYLLALKTIYPDKIFLLRGNHETKSCNTYYGFWAYVATRYSEELYDLYNHVFSYLPIAAVIGDNIFCVHGGIAKGLENINTIKDFKKGEKDPEDSIVLQLLWNDPVKGDAEGFVFNHARGDFYCFGKKVFLEFMKNNNLLLTIRSHEVFSTGYRYFFDNKLLSIFSAPMYRGYNKGKYVELSENLHHTLSEVRLKCW